MSIPWALSHYSVPNTIQREMLLTEPELVLLWWPLLLASATKIPTSLPGCWAVLVASLCDNVQLLAWCFALPLQFSHSS